MNRGKHKIRRLSDLSPDFQEFVRETYAKMNVPVPEWVHCDIEQLKRDVGSKNIEFQKYFAEKGVPPYRPAQVRF